MKPDPETLDDDALERDWGIVDDPDGGRDELIVDVDDDDDDEPEAPPGPTDRQTD